MVWGIGPERVWPDGVFALSLFNAVILLWLATMVVLNSARRSVGTWIAAGAMLCGAAFFFSQADVAFDGTALAGQAAFVWWPLLWTTCVLLPFAWYLAIRWHTGHLSMGVRTEGRAARWLFVATVGLCIGLFAALLNYGATRDARSWAAYDSVTYSRAYPVAPEALLYAIFVGLCTLLSIHALLRPGAPADDVVGLARRRARPWLIGASGALLAVGIVTAWLIDHIARGHLLSSANGGWPAIYADAIITGFATVACILQGQAIVSYEIFTGRTLPQRGLVTHWRGALAIALGFSLVTTGLAFGDLGPMSGLLFAVIMIVGISTALSRRAYVERDRLLASLRPFVGPRLYGRLVGESPAVGIGVAEPFRALCERVVEARLAFLIPAGGHASLVERPIPHPAEARLAPDVVEAILTAIDRGMEPWVRLDPLRHGGLGWAVPLHGPHGLVGVLALEERPGGRLYARDELEMARIVCERLIDTQATLGLAERVIELQRKRYAETHVIDRRVRRALHDDILPRLHAAMVELAAVAPRDVVDQLGEIHHRASALLREIPQDVPDLAATGLLSALSAEVNHGWGTAFDAVEWDIQPEAEAIFNGLSPLAAEVVFCAAREAGRNAARHGRGTDSGRRLTLWIALTASPAVTLTLTDDGVGMAPPASEDDGKLHHGLTLHGTMMAIIGGVMLIETPPAGGTRIVLRLPRGDAGWSRQGPT